VAWRVGGNAWSGVKRHPFVRMRRAHRFGYLEAQAPAIARRVDLMRLALVEEVEGRPKLTHLGRTPYQGMPNDATILDTKTRLPPF
jgi:hypothetical protein